METSFRRGSLPQPCAPWIGVVAGRVGQRGDRHGVEK